MGKSDKGMITPEQQRLQNLFIEIFLIMKKEFKFTDKKTLMLAASTYVTNQKDFNLNRFVSIYKFITKKARWSMYLNSHVRYAMAALLDSRFADPMDAFVRLDTCYDMLVAEGFRRSSYTYIAASILVGDEQPDSETKKKVERALTMYRLMKKEHFFLTGEDDYPLTVLLSQHEDRIEELVDKINYAYKKLAGWGFKKGNELQLLSQIVTLEDGLKVEEKVECTYHLYQRIKGSTMKIKRMHYPEIGLLALLEIGEQDIPVIVEIKKQLDGEKLLKWQRDLNLKMAIHLYVSSYSYDNNIANTGLLTAVEGIMQAQQMAMIGAVVGATAVSASTGN
ncbi:DUF4003 domain-containing protein [Mechercharimyces sp. CAU 1602]|uniref:DUF4003 domain-containing protein n=1 Tax=Mechercharimyces sp. CAU 1602 TaxID=2973933 RepID=UPI0021632279|nr:DUF4003 domain-containing protein [Mechercharimyces sp. CAU 1602]MCS1350654.1 DUF4003 domain-containing protein [Mechercharimyces sp. CAU 1602]